MFQGEGANNMDMNRDLGFKAEDIDFVILSHAHIDHSGLLPRLILEGYKGKIYTTAASISLCEIMLQDSAYIQEHDLKFVNKRKKKQNKELLEPLYKIDDVFETMSRFVP